MKRIIPILILIGCYGGISSQTVSDQFSYLEYPGLLNPSYGSLEGVHSAVLANRSLFGGYGINQQRADEWVGTINTRLNFSKREKRRGYFGFKDGGVEPFIGAWIYTRRFTFLKRNQGGMHLGAIHRNSQRKFAISAAGSYLIANNDNSWIDYAVLHDDDPFFESGVGYWSHQAKLSTSIVWGRLRIGGVASLVWANSIGLRNDTYVFELAYGENFFEKGVGKSGKNHGPGRFSAAGNIQYHDKQIHVYGGADYHQPIRDRHQLSFGIGASNRTTLVFRIAFRWRRFSIPRKNKSQLTKYTKLNPSILNTGYSISYHQNGWSNHDRILKYNW